MFPSKRYRFPVCGFSWISSSTNQLQVTHNEAKQEEKRRKISKERKPLDLEELLVEIRGETAEKERVLTHASTTEFGLSVETRAELRLVFYTSEKSSCVKTTRYERMTCRFSMCAQLQYFSTKYSPKTTTKT